MSQQMTLVGKIWVWKRYIPWKIGKVLLVTKLIQQIY